MKSFRYPTALTIAGSDSGGGAGIQADIKTFSALGVYGMSIITAITAQNTLNVRGIQAVDPKIVKQQVDAVFEDFIIDAVKIGMLHNKRNVEIIAEAIDTYSPSFVILDPVMISTSGSKLMSDDAIEAIISLLFPKVTLITPNIYETAFLSSVQVDKEEDMENAASVLLEKGCKAVLIKGGHLEGDYRTDILFTKETPPLRLASPTIETSNTHGTGCTLASAIAAHLALGASLPEAVKEAKEYMNNALITGMDVITGHGPGPVNHFFSPIPLKKIEED